MPGQVRPAAATIESTYKAREVEGILDLYFYRKVGFWLASFCATLRLTPSVVTVIGGVFGLAAGHLYFYPDLRLNLIGMALHVCANIFDNADGQLARLTATQSRAGRILDAYADHLVWISIYVHLTVRCAGGGAHPMIYLIGLAAGVSHALQGGVADYYRTTYLHFLKGRSGDQLDRSVVLAEEYRGIGSSRPWSKFMLLNHLNYTRQQEMLSPNLCRLRDQISQSPGDAGERVKEFQRRAKPAFKWWGFLMTNTRMLILFACLILRRPLWYFWVELTAFNLLLLYLMRRQERMAQALLRSPALQPVPAAA